VVLLVVTVVVVSVGVVIITGVILIGMGVVVVVFDMILVSVGMGVSKVVIVVAGKGTCVGSRGNTLPKKRLVGWWIKSYSWTVIYLGQITNWNIEVEEWQLPGGWCQ
jgi:hypothetical protein